MTFSELISLNRKIGVSLETLMATRHPICTQCDALTKISNHYLRTIEISARAKVAFLKLQQAAKNDNIEIYLISAYRSPSYQSKLIENKLRKNMPLDQILEVNALPGFSEHHTGRALDLGTSKATDLDERFVDTLAYQWLQAHAAGFDFYLSYPANNPYGIAFEPWHWCYQAS